VLGVARDLVVTTLAMVGVTLALVE
jgi:hypothetical protein